MPMTTWPTCPACGQGYSITTGLPVTINPPTVRSIVEAEVDFGDAADIEVGEDGSDSISCGCTEPPEPTEEAMEQLVTLLADLSRAAFRIAPLCYVDLEDARS